MCLFAYPVLDVDLVVPISAWRKMIFDLWRLTIRQSGPFRAVEKVSGGIATAEEEQVVYRY